MVRYVGELIGSSTEPVYLLPLRFDHPVGQFDLKAEVVRGTHKPVVTSDLSNFEFSKWEDRWIAKTSMTRASLTRDLRVALPQTPNLVVSVEHDGPEDIVFAIHDQPQIPEQQAQSSKQPGRVHLWWDASMSHGPEERKVELEFLRRLLGHWNNLTLDITPFRDQPGAQRSFVIRNGATSEIELFLENLPYDGGTDLADITLNDTVNGKPYDIQILVSDGIGTIGKVPGTPKIPVFTLTAAGAADHTLLRHLADTSGGAHLNLGVMTNEMALELVGLEPFSLLAVDYNPDEVTELYPGTRRPVTGRVHISGKLIAEEATVVLRYGYGSTEVSRREVRLRRSDTSDTGLVPRFWAQQKVERMMVASELDRDHLLALGRRYGIVTAETSLLVLETLEQHLEYGIEPPESRPDLRNRWLAHQSRTQKLQDHREAPRIDHILALWKARTHWWRTDFSNWRKKRFFFQSSVSSTHTTDANQSASENTSSSRLTTQRAGEYVLRIDQPADHTVRMEEENRREELLERRVEAEAERSVRELAHIISRETELRAVLEDSGEFLQADATSSADYAQSSNSVQTLRTLNLSTNLEVSSSLEFRAVDSATTGAAQITLKRWDPRTPYMANLKAAAESGRAYQVYLDQRAGFGNSPAYFLDCAVFLHEYNQPQLARRVLTSILELGLDEPDLLRVVAYRLIDVGDLDIATNLFEDVLEMRPEEPQSYRDLANVLALRWENSDWRLAHPQQADQNISRAMALLHPVVFGRWDLRLQEIEIIALMELNRLMAMVDRLLPEKRKEILRPDLDPRLAGVLDVGLRIVLSWDTDLTDIDLWITEPTGNNVFYQKPHSAIGGRLSRDFTQGYGPEEYLLKQPIPGSYKIRAKYYGTHQRNLLGPVTVKAVIFTNWAHPDEERRELTLRLDRVRDIASIGEVRIN